MLKYGFKYILIHLYNIISRFQTHVFFVQTLSKVDEHGGHGGDLFDQTKSSAKLSGEKTSTKRGDL